MNTIEKLKIYYDEDINTKYLKDKNIAVLGFGSQGSAQALNLRDSGANLKVALRANSSKIRTVQQESIDIVSVEDAVKWADLVVMLIPDECHKEVYENQIKNNLKSGSTILFAHGFSIVYKQIIPREDINVVMVSPKGIGPKVRANYERGGGVPGLVAVEQDVTGEAKQIALAYAGLIGCGKSGILDTTFKEETTADLFGEQVVLCGGVSSLLKAAFETLVEGGCSPQMAYFECFHELKLITDLLYENGITGTRNKISNTARYGDLTRGPRVISESTKEAMRQILSEIQSGEFAQEWIEENNNGKPNFYALSKADETHELETVGQEIRSRLKWLK